MAVDPELLQAFRHSRADPTADEVRMAVLVARLLDAGTDGPQIEGRLGRLADECPAGTAPWRYLASLGFAGNRETYDALDNSNLAWVLANRRGIPISLAVVLIRVARRAGRIAAGINFPGHFLVQVDDVLVDPFIMETVHPAALMRPLTAAGDAVDPEVLFAAASPMAVGLRMLNNVKLAHGREGAWHKALDVIDAQLALAPQRPELHLEQGELWRRLGSVAAARQSWQRALELATVEDMSDVEHAARERLDALGGAQDVLH